LKRSEIHDCHNAVFILGDAIVRITEKGKQNNTAQGNLQCLQKVQSLKLPPTSNS